MHEYQKVEEERKKISWKYERREEILLVSPNERERKDTPPS